MQQYWTICLVAAAQLAAAEPASRSRYRIATIAGSDKRGDGGAAIAAQIGSIQGVTVDRAGNLYLADTDYHRVRKVSAAGLITTIAGTGSAGFSGDGGAATSAQLNLPYGLAIDGAGNLYIADLGNHRVRRVGPDGTITTVAGTGRKGSSGDDGRAYLAQLMSPRNLAVDAAGTLYISEFEGHRVRRVTPDGVISTVAGTGVAGFSGDGLPARTAQLGFPAGLAVDRGGALYICDSQNHRVRKILPGGLIMTVLGGAPGARLLTPTAVAVDASNTIFVGDRSASVRQYTTAGVWSVAAGEGQTGHEGDNGPAAKAKLSAVNDVAIDLLGNLLIADGTRVRRVSPLSTITTVAGDGYLRWIGDGGPATAASLLRPSGLALDPAGNLFIADTGTERVRQISPGGIITTLAGTGRAGYDEVQSVAGGTPLNAPTGLTVDVFGIVTIADSGNHRIRRVWQDGRIRNLLGTGVASSSPDNAAPDQVGLQMPRGVCADRAGTVYVVDTANHRVLRAPAAGLITTAAGNGSKGDAGDGGPARLAQLNQPETCVVDSGGNLLIADTGSHRIRMVTPAGVISTVAGTGTEGFSGDGGPATSARLRVPRGVALDNEGRILIADTGNNRIRRIEPDGVISTLAGTDAAGFSGDGGPAAQAQLNAPSSVIAGAMGVILVADTGNNRIRRLSIEELPPEPLLALPEINVANAASDRAGPIAPGEIVAITGEAIGPEIGLTASLDTAGLIPNLLAEAEVLFDGVPAPLFYVQASRILAQVPYSVSGLRETFVEVRYRKQVRGVRSVAVVDAAPAIFATVQNQDGTRNSATVPAARGSVLTLYVTGEGMTDGPNISGLPPAAPLPRPSLPVTVRIAGIQCDVLYAGGAPGQAGVMQADVRAPSGFVPPGAAAVELSVGSFAAPPVTVWLK